VPPYLQSAVQPIEEQTAFEHILFKEFARESGEVCCSVLQQVAVCCGVLQQVVVCCSVLQQEAVSTFRFSKNAWLYSRGKITLCCCLLQCAVRGAAYCNVLQCVAVCCSVLRCVAKCCSVLQCVTGCCSVFQCVAVCWNIYFSLLKEFVGILLRCRRSVLQCVAVCCSAVQCVAARCSAVQCSAVC